MAGPRLPGVALGRREYGRDQLDLVVGGALGDLVHDRRGQVAGLAGRPRGATILSAGTPRAAPSRRGRCRWRRGSRRRWPRGRAPGAVVLAGAWAWLRPRRRAPAAHRPSAAAAPAVREDPCIAVSSKRPPAGPSGSVEGPRRGAVGSCRRCRVRKKRISSCNLRCSGVVSTNADVQAPRLGLCPVGRGVLPRAGGRAPGRGSGPRGLTVQGLLGPGLGQPQLRLQRGLRGHARRGGGDRRAGLARTRARVARADRRA
jgi:hypothetical protein